MTNARYSFIWAGTSLFFLLLLFIGIPIGIHEIHDATTEFGIGPRSWPSLVTGLIVVASAYQAFHFLKLHRLARESGREDSNVEQMPFAPQPLVITFALLFLYYFSVSYLGIALASLIFFVIFSIRSGEKRYLMLVGIGAVLAVGLYYFFYYIARIPMPPGPFGGVI